MENDQQNFDPMLHHMEMQARMAEAANSDSTDSSVPASPPSGKRMIFYIILLLAAVIGGYLLSL